VSARSSLSFLAISLRGYVCAVGNPCPAVGINSEACSCLVALGDQQSWVHSKAAFTVQAYNLFSTLEPALLQSRGH